MKTKVMTIVGTRPEIIKLSRVISELDKFTDHVLVHTGQNYDYELNEIFFNDLKIRKPNHFLNAVGQKLLKLYLKLFMNQIKLLSQKNLMRFFLYGDTNSCLISNFSKKKTSANFSYGSWKQML